MLKLALCDDDPQQCAAVGALLQEYAALRPALAAKLSIFSSSWELLADEEEGACFDLYVLDVVMPEVSGIELGVKLRELGRSGAIIYLTISPEYAVDSYAAQAFYYLMKPVEPERLWQPWRSGGLPASRSRPRTACNLSGWTASSMRSW